jgi:nicotinate-nucleotide adenylyltransferase
MRIGILGGTFDPIHLGHIRPAQEVKQQLGLDSIWLMPNHFPPHKQGTHSSTQTRLDMARQVCESLEGFELCDIEAKRHTPSYTVTTLKTLTAQYPEHSFAFIMGMDSFLSLPSWHKWQALFELADIVVCQRPGWHLPPGHPMTSLLLARGAQPSSLYDARRGRIFSINITPQPFSSTRVREQLQQGLDVGDALLPITLAYIQRHGLYRP